MKRRHSARNPLLLHVRVWGLLLAFSIIALSLPVASKTTASSPHSKTQTFSAALRYLRIDLRYEVIERDADAAYLMFREPPGDQDKENIQSIGSLEIVETNTGVRVIANLPQKPRYYERTLTNGLLKKLRDEYGEPTKPRPPDSPEEDAPSGAESPSNQPKK